MKGKLLGIFGVLVVLCTCLAFATADPWWNLGTSKFLQPGNIQNLLSRISMFGILGIGVAFVIITSGIDLSIGSTVCLCGVLLSILLHVDYQPAQQFDVLRVNAADKVIVLRDRVDAMKPGSSIRYTGGVGAGLVLTVRTMREADGEFLVSVQEEIRRDELGGRIVLTIPKLRVMVSGSETVAELAAGSGVETGDQLQFVKADGSVTTQKVAAVSTSGDSSRVTLAGDLGGKYHNDVFAVVLKRNQWTSIPAAITAVLCIGMCLGLVHGWLVTRIRLQPFVVTLCALLIYRGVSRWLTNDNPAGFGELQQVLGPVASGRLGLIYRGDEMLFGIPIPFFLLTGIGLIASVFLGRTIWGRYLLALGRNEEAARFSGINTGQVTLLAYVICTMLAALGGMLFALDSSSVSPSSFGNSYELYAIAAAVLGGCSLRGGEGSILGVVIGTAVMQVLNNLIMLLKIPQSLEYTIIGSVILIGVLSDEVLRRAAARRRLKQSIGGQ